MHYTAIKCIRKELDKVVIADGNNNAEVWGRSLHPPEANGGSGAEPLTLRRFLHFSPNTHF